MKNIYISLFLALSTSLSASAQTNFHELVSGLWYSGAKQDVLNIAEQRLNVNSNDLAGLLLKLEYQEEFLQLNNMTGTMARVIDVGMIYAGTNFAEEFSMIQADYELMKDIVTNYPPDDLAADMAKTNATGKTMSCDAAIKALQDDGYFQ